MSAPNSRDGFDDLPILAELREALDRSVQPGTGDAEVPRRRLAGRWLGATARGVPVALAVLVVVAVAVVALTLGRHGRSPTPTPTTDAVGIDHSLNCQAAAGYNGRARDGDPKNF